VSVASLHGVTIREAIRDDVPTLGRLGALLVRMHHDLDPARFLPATPRTELGYAAFLESQLDTPGSIVLVAEQDGTVVGYTFAAVEGVDYMALRGPAGVLHDIVVDPDHRAAGVGHMLLAATVRALRETGIRQVVLSSAARNESAQRLFERRGFRRTMVEMTLDQG
jgi:ribosomal protein S18 acetylase RimI-like enzyme